jgi:hypothetical protein
MNEGKFIAIQNYLEEIASQNKQIIGQLQRTNELLATMIAPAPVTAEIINLDTPEAVDGIMPAPAASKPKASAKRGK